MPARTITDEEIALIKAMIYRGMKVKDIQFFFNRPNRSVNSGRISGIRSGKYSNSASIERATDADLDAFLAKFKPTQVSGLVSVPGSTGQKVAGGPVDQPTLVEMFERDDAGIWHFRHSESDTHECKESFGFKHSDKWLRAIAALANNLGGYVLFGVKDKEVVGGKITRGSYRVLGMSSTEFEDADPAYFSQRIKAPFDPTPRVERAILNLDSLKVGVLYVHQHAGRPVIATKNEGNGIREGDIYFRYPGQTARIKYSDLRAILDDRDRQARQQILPMISKLLTLGPRDAMIADLAGGSLSDDKRSILIGADLLDRIKFIREGQFEETEGTPTLRLVGDVQAVSAEPVIRQGFVTPADLIDTFLDLNSPYDPMEYIRCAVEGGNSTWLPIHFYARKADCSGEQLADFIATTKAPSKKRKRYRERALGAVSAYQPVGGKSAEIVQLLKSGRLPEVVDVIDAANVGRALAALDFAPKIPLEDILMLIRHCVDIISKSAKPGWMSAIRRGIARIDELYFGQDGGGVGSS